MLDTVSATHSRRLGSPPNSNDFIIEVINDSYSSILVGEG